MRIAQKKVSVKCFFFLPSPKTNPQRGERERERERKREKGDKE
jgi:hypothetical protein